MPRLSNAGGLTRSDESPQRTDKNGAQFQYSDEGACGGRNYLLLALAVSTTVVSAAFAAVFAGGPRGAAAVTAPTIAWENTAEEVFLAFPLALPAPRAVAAAVLTHRHDLVHTL